MPPRRFFAGAERFGLAVVVAEASAASGAWAVVVAASAAFGVVTTAAGVVCPVAGAGSSADAGIAQSSDAALASAKSAANRLNAREEKEAGRIQVVFTSHGYVERSNLLLLGQTLPE